MDIQAEKIELVKQILDTEDEALLQGLKAMLAGHQNVVHEDLPEYVKKEVELSRQQAAQGSVISNEEIIEKYKRFDRNR